MPRGRLPTSARSDNSEMDRDGSESELVKLQRQLRIMEKDRKAYNIQAREQIRKQEQEIEKLLKEQEELVRNLGVCKSLSRQRSDSEDTQRLQALLERRAMVDEDLDMERQCQKEIAKEISNMESRLAKVKKKQVASSDTQKSEERHTQKSIRTLEYKLDRATTRLNEQLTNNGQVREELQTLHIERTRFQQLQNRLNKELQKVRKKIGEIINLSTTAYDARAEAQSKMTMMREKAAKDLAQYNAEMKELERVIAHDYNLKEFMTTKCSERSGQDDHEMGPRQLSELKEQRRTDSGEESLDALEEVFERIQAVTGEDNLDLLVTRFIQVEDRNFALLNFVNEQNNEAEAVNDQISQIKDEIEQLTINGQQQDRDHRALLRDVEEDQKEIESQTKDYENEANVISSILDDIKTGVSSIFSNMECDRSVIEDMLGSSAGFTDNNIMSYLGLVEQKTNELLTVQAFLNSKDLEKDYNPNDLAKFLLGQNPDVLLKKDLTQPAGSNVEYDAEEPAVTDEDERPLSHEELRRKIMKAVRLRDD